MAAPSPPSASKREAACNAILDAASLLIAEKGIDGFTISEVAKRARINRALIYHYFGGRDSLVAQAIEHVMRRYEPLPPEAGAESMERAVRMHIEHPEIARFFFQMLLSDRSLPRIGEHTMKTIDAWQRFKREHAPHAPLDPTFVVIIIELAQLSWSFARHEFARLLGISVKEADRRFIAQLQRPVELRVQALMTGDNGDADDTEDK